jgi:thiosulfate dehydrogenase [quinone] large subunit
MTQQHVGPNVFESHLGGVTVRTKAHQFSAWFVLALRLMMGYAFLHSGVDKILGGSFSAGGYLGNVAVPWDEALIGIGLLVGGLTRLAAFFGVDQYLEKLDFVQQRPWLRYLLG